MPRRRLVGALIGALAISAAAVAGPVQAAGSPVQPPSGHYGRLGAPTKVNLASLPSGGKAAPAGQLSHLHHNEAAYQEEKALVGQGSAGRTSGIITPSGRPQQRAAAPHAASSAGQLPLSTFAGDSLQQQTSLQPNQDAWPPDTQLAVGPGHIVEATNSILMVWSRPNTFIKSADLNTFFGSPPGQRFTDPRLMYDAESARWFLSGLTLNPSTADSTVFIAVSASSDPTGTWSVSVVATRVHELADQPETGVNSDKVVVSWNDFSSVSQSATFLGAETVVVQKSDLLTASSQPHIMVFGPDPMRYRIVPAQALGPTTTEWLAFDNADCPSQCTTGAPTIGVIAIDGTPAMTNVTWKETDPPIVATAVPPSPRQPSGVPVDQAIEDTFLSSVWQNGTLWVTGNDACLPPGDSIARACIRLISLSTSGASPSVTLDGELGDPGLDEFYAAVTLNDVGDAFIAYSESSPSLFPSAEGIYVYANSTTSSPQVTIAAGLGSYSAGGPQRWGDYSAAARDPSNTTQVWLTAEYQASATDVRDWGTFAGVLAAEPLITGVQPSLGLLAGGQTVTLSGHGFRAGPSVSFGGNAASNVTELSSTRVTAVTPAAAAAGAVDVKISQPDGTSGVDASGYTYSTALGTEYTAVAPTRLLDTRAINAALGPGMTQDLQVAGIATVPASAQTVVLNVTVTNTTAPSFLTVFPAGQARPLASNLNWVAGKTVPNLVAVPVGEGGAVSFFNAAGNADVVVDLEGYFGPVNGTKGEFQPLPPNRVLDTRNGTGATVGKLGPGAMLNLQVTGNGVPASGVSAVVMNLTATGPTASSFLTAWPAGAARPLASNLNFASGQTVPNRVVVPVGASGQVSIYNAAGSTDVVADVNGYFTDATASGGQLLLPVSPFRIEDTRTSGQTLGPARSLFVPVAAGAIPADATAAVLNVTATGTTAPSFFTVYPGTGAPPLASDLNWPAGSTVPNLVVVKLGGGGISVFNQAGSADAVVDIFGYFVPTPGLVVTAQPASVPASAASTSTVTVAVTAGDGTAPSGDAITFATGGGTACGSITSSSPTTDANGKASAVYTASTTAGSCLIDVTDTTRSFNGSVTITQT